MNPSTTSEATKSRSENAQEHVSKDTQAKDGLNQGDRPSSAPTPGLPANDESTDSAKAEDTRVEEMGDEHEFDDELDIEPPPALSYTARAAIRFNVDKGSMTKGGVKGVTYK